MASDWPGQRAPYWPRLKYWPPAEMEELIGAKKIYHLSYYPVKI